jgi:hypothetical protein
MLTPELATKIAKMYKAGSPDDHGEFAEVLRQSEDMADVLAKLCVEQARAMLQVDPALAVAAALLMVEIGYRMAKTEMMEEAFSK